MSLAVEIDREAVRALWREARGDLEASGTLGRLADGAEGVLREVFLHLLSDVFHDVLEGVALRADGAAQHVFGLRIRRAFHRHFAACAVERLGLPRAPVDAGSTRALITELCAAVTTRLRLDVGREALS